jgi:phytoene dehydrogenase-like protein
MQYKKALVIGGGIAGLCTGIYLRKNSFDTEIVEMHTMPGGLATAWQRDGYTFENCVHWLVGSKEGGQFNAMWKEVFDIGRLSFFDDPVFQVIERGGQRLVIYRNTDRLEQELLEKAPEDEKAIRKLIRLVRKLSRMRLSEGDSLWTKFAGYVRMLPLLPVLARYSRYTMAAWAAKYKNPCLKAFFGDGLADLSFLAMAFSLAWMGSGNAGYPINGSLRMIGLISDRYRELGGTIRFQSRVQRILVEKGHAAGVVLENGEEIRADLVVSAADGHATFFEMLGDKYLDERTRKIYATFKPFPSYLQVSLGVDADLTGEPGAISLGLDREIAVDPQTRLQALGFRIFNFDPTFASPGKTAVVCIIGTYNHEYWSSLRERDRAAYETEKKRIAGEVVEAFSQRFPAARGKIEVMDVSTPATVIRYTGNWRGSMEGWLLTPSTGFRSLPATLPGLKDFYLVGQWISPGGGLPSGLLTARSVARRICRDHGRRWRAK